MPHAHAHTHTQAPVSRRVVPDRYLRRYESGAGKEWLENENPQHLRKEHPIKSDQIRHLAEKYGHDRTGHNLCGPIAWLLDLRYQFVRNVLVEQERKRESEGGRSEKTETEIALRVPAVLVRKMKGVEEKLGMRRSHIIIEALTDKVDELEHLASIMHRIKDGKKKYSLEEVQAMMDD